MFKWCYSRNSEYQVTKTRAERRGNLSKTLYGELLVEMRNLLAWLTSEKCSHSFNVGSNDL